MEFAAWKGFKGGHWQQEDDSFDAVIGQTQVPDSELDAYI